MFCLPLLHLASTLQASFHRAESRTEQPWISSCVASTAQEIAWCRAAETEDDCVAVKVQPQMARASAGSQLCCTPSVRVVIPCASSGSVCSLAGSEQPCTHVFICCHRAWMQGEPLAQKGEGGLLWWGMGMVTVCAVSGDMDATRRACNALFSWLQMLLGLKSI